MINWLRDFFKKKPKYKYTSPIYKGPDVFEGHFMPRKSMELLQQWMIAKYGEETQREEILAYEVERSPAHLVKPRKEPLFNFLYWEWVFLN
jgi:hypothetical protein